MQALSRNLPGYSPTIYNRWNTTNPDPCLWEDRVICSSYKSFSRVTELNLGSLGLDTSTTDNSNFFFELLCRLDALQTLWLDANSFTTVPTSLYSNCTGLYGSLRKLDFSYNRLAGPIGNFSSFRMLEGLVLSHDTLEGQVSSQLDGLVHLRRLYLGHNYLSGSIPINPGLEILDLTGNRFEGQIPVEITRLRNLTELVISSNGLSGTIPNNLSRIKQLRLFYASDNNLSGTIPVNLTRYLSRLDLGGNRLTGEIPSDLLSSPTLFAVSLASNFLQGQIPQNLSQNLDFLDLSNNVLHGSIPQEIGLLLRLFVLLLDGNELDGPIPHQLGRCNNSLTVLDLSANRLQGELPVELGNLTLLRTLDLRGNCFRGNIPTALSNLVELRGLDLGHNLLTGVIPYAIFNLTDLSVLNLEYNKLSGLIHSAIINLEHLTSLQLGKKNKLSGTIPKLPGSLSLVDLSGNLFNGPIPLHFHALNLLEILDLSDNMFTGEVLTFFTKMENLIQINLSNNQLSGILPRFPGWINVSITGNINLTRSDDEMIGNKDIKQGKTSVIGSTMLSL